MKIMMSTIFCSLIMLLACNNCIEHKSKGFCDFTRSVLVMIKDEKYPQVKCLYVNPEEDYNNMVNAFKKVNKLILEKGVPNDEHIKINKEYFSDGAKNAFVTIYFDSISDEAENRVTFFLKEKDSEIKIISLMTMIHRLH